MNMPIESPYDFLFDGNSNVCTIICHFQNIFSQNVRDLDCPLELTKVTRKYASRKPTSDFLFNACPCVVVLSQTVLVHQRDVRTLPPPVFAVAFRLWCCRHRRWRSIRASAVVAVTRRTLPVRRRDCSSSAPSAGYRDRRLREPATPVGELRRRRWRSRPARFHRRQTADDDAVVAPPAYICGGVSPPFRRSHAGVVSPLAADRRRPVPPQKRSSAAAARRQNDYLEALVKLTACSSTRPHNDRSRSPPTGTGSAFRRRRRRRYLKRCRSIRSWLRRLAFWRRFRRTPGRRRRQRRRLVFLRRSTFKLSVRSSRWFLLFSTSTSSPPRRLRTIDTASRTTSSTRISAVIYNIFNVAVRRIVKALRRTTSPRRLPERARRRRVARSETCSGRRRVRRKIRESRTWTTSAVEQPPASETTTTATFANTSRVDY